MGKTSLKVALFGAFIVCLYVSIPHLAWVFYSWEQVNPTQDSPISIALFGIDILTTKQGWLNAYLQAMSIDVIIAFLSITLTNSKDKTHTGIGYTFVTLLIALSWFFNWLYAKDHAPVNAGIWSHTEVWGLVHLDTLTAIITSALPVFALAFTVMIDVLTGEKITADQIEAKAIEEEKKNTSLKRLRKAKEERQAETISRVFRLAQNVKKNGKSLIGKPETKDVNDLETKPETSPETGDVNDLETDSETISVTDWETDDETEMETTPETSGVIHRETTTGELPAIPVSIERDTDEIKVSPKRPRKAKQIVSTKEQEVRRLLRKRPTMTATEIAEKVGVSRQYVGQIKRSLELAS